MKGIVFETDKQCYLSSCISYIGEELKKLKVSQKDSLKLELLCEESILKLVRYIPDSGSITVRVRHSLSGGIIEISGRGDEIAELSDSGNISYAAKALEDDEDIDTGLLILKANGESVKYSHSDGINLIKIRIKAGGKKSMHLTLLALVSSIIVGLLFRQFVPEAFNLALCDYIFSPFRTMFINALKMVVAPVVFFSIVTCISQFASLSELGRIGAKVMGMYFFTTLLAICVGFGMFFLINPGTFGAAAGIAAGGVDSVTAAGAEVSILNTIINIVPSNLFKPFVESDTLQIIFLAVLLGFAVGMIGDYSRIIKDLFESCNELFLTVTTIIAKFIPLAVFCSMFIMITQIGTDTMMDMFGMAVTVILALLLMMCVYALLILLIGRVNPITFFRKNWPGMLTAFSLASSNAAMPTNIRICTDSLGISPKVCTFSIPLGATVNMDGVSIHLVIATMFLAKVYGVDVQGPALFSIILTIVILSLGAPGVPGSSLVCLGILLQQIGVPVEALGIIMGIDSLIDMFRTVSNTTGDMAVTLIVSSREKLLDREKFEQL